MDLLNILISLLTFLTVFLGIFAINLVFTDLFKQEKQGRLDEMERELRERLREKMREEAHAGNENLSELSEDVAESHHISLVSIWNSFSKHVRQAGINANPLQIITTSLVLAAGLGMATWLLTGLPIATGVCTAIALYLPFLYVQFKRNRRLGQLLGQLPDALELMSRIMRAGQTINQGMQVVAEEFREPVSHEFAFCYEQQNLGIAADVALRQLAERTGLMEIRIMVMGVLIQTQTGGNLALLLDKLADIIRKRDQMKQQVRSLTAEGRMQATILLGLPFAVWFGLMVVNRTYAMKLLDHPELIWTTLAVMAIGAVWIRKIVNFDF